MHSSNFQVARMRRVLRTQLLRYSPVAKCFRHRFNPRSSFSLYLFAVIAVSYIHSPTLASLLSVLKSISLPMEFKTHPDSTVSTVSITFLFFLFVHASSTALLPLPRSFFQRNVCLVTSHICFLHAQSFSHFSNQYRAIYYSDASRPSRGASDKSYPL